MTKKIIILTAVLLLATVFTSGVFADAEADSEQTDVASVNGTIIVADDVKREMNMMYQQSVQQGVYPDSSEIEAFWSRAVDTLIGRELLYQDAISNGYTPDAARIDEYISYLTQNSGGEEALQAKLDEQGLNIEKLRKDTGAYYVISEYVTGVLSTGVSVTEDKVQKYYDENIEMFNQEETVTARHILLLVEEGADQAVIDEVKSRITALRERILAGEDFSEIARVYSEGPSSEQGGNLGEFGRGRMVPPFDEAVFSLEPGVVSEPVLTQFGYHLIEVTSKNDGGTIPFADIKPQIREYLMNIALEEKVNLYVEGIRNNSEIIIFE